MSATIETIAGSLLFALTLGACAATPPAPVTVGSHRPAEPSPTWLECPRLESFADEAALEAALPELSRRVEGRDLLVLGTTVFECPCSEPQRLGGAETTALARGETSGTNTRGATASVDIAGDSVDTRLRGAGTSTAVRGGAGSTHLRGDETHSRVTGSGSDVASRGDETTTALRGEGTRVERLGTRSSTAASGSETSTAHRGASSDTVTVGSGTSTRTLGADTTNRVRGATMVPRCAKVRRALAYLVQNPGNSPVHVYDGVQLYELERERLVAVDSVR